MESLLCSIHGAGVLLKPMHLAWMLLKAICCVSAILLFKVLGVGLPGVLLRMLRQCAEVLHCTCTSPFRGGPLPPGLQPRQLSSQSSLLPSADTHAAAALTALAGVCRRLPATATGPCGAAAAPHRAALQSHIWWGAVHPFCQRR